MDTFPAPLTLQQAEWLAERLKGGDPLKILSTVRYVIQQHKQNRDKLHELVSRAKCTGHIAPVEQVELDRERSEARASRTQARRKKILDKLQALSPETQEAILKQLRGKV